MPRCGTRSAYASGCRCEPCTVANRVYARELRRHRARVSYGIETHVDPYVDADDARAHLNWLSAQGVGRRAVSEATGLSQSNIVKIRSGKRQRIRRETEASILAVGTHRRRPRSLVDLDKAQVLIDDLLTIGYTKAAIAKALGAQTPALQLSKRMTAERMARLVEVYTRLVAMHPVHHGTLSGHRDHGCRCMACRRWAADQAAMYRARRAAA